MSAFGNALLSWVALFGVSTIGAQAPPVKTAEFSGDLGLVNSAGNSNVTSITLGDKLVFRSGDARHAFTQLFGFVYGRSEGETIANSWRASGRYELGLTKRLFLYGLVAAERNRFAGIQRRFEEGPGFIVKAVMSAKDNLDFEGGLSAVQQLTTDDVRDSFVAGRFSALFRHKLSEKASFGQVVEFLPNLQESKDYRLNSETSILAPISSKIALKATYTIRFDNTPLVTATKTFKKTDRQFTTGVQISY